MKAWKKLLIMIGTFGLFEALYQLALYFEKRYFPYTPVCLIVLFVIVGGLLAAFMILNRGFERGDCSPDDLSSAIPYEERVKLAEKYNRNKKRAKIIMMLFIPAALVLTLDLLDLYFNFFDAFGEIFS